MEFNEACKIIKEANISEEETLGFMAAVIALIGGFHDWDLDELYKVTGWGYDDIAGILTNFYDNEIIVDGKLNMEVHKDELSNIVELTLIALCGEGEIVRREVDKEIKPKEMKLKFFNAETNKFDTMQQRKTLNDHLFDTLDRLSSADSENIQTEIDKAGSIISVSEQILNVTRLKLDVMQAAGNLAAFSEIDIVKELPEGDDVKKKSLT